MQNRKKVNGAVRGLKIVAFGAVLAVMTFIGLLWFLRPKISEVEKRTLTEFPALTWSGFWDGSYFGGIDTWYADTFPLREPLIRANQSLQEHYGVRSDQLVGNVAMVADAIPVAGESTDGEPESAEAAAAPTPTPTATPADGTVTQKGDIQGNIYITQNCGYLMYYFSQSGADLFANTMNNFYQNVKDMVDVYVVVAPLNSGIMLDESVQEDMGNSDERESINYIYSQMDDGIHTVNAFDNLRQHNAEYLYFHTDHHWTALGAYYAYQSFCEEKGITAHDYRDYDTIEFPNFMGTLYSSSNQSAALAANPDTVVAYYPKGTNDMSMTLTSGATYDWRIVNDVSDYPNTEYYATFSGGDNPFSVAHNPTITDGSAVVVIKDSYGNAFIPWLVDHYEYIYWLDVRYTNYTISQMVEEFGVQDVIVTVHLYNGSTDSITGYLSNIGQ